MGFMAGFGKAFSDSYNQARSEAKAEERDMLRYTMDEYSKQREKRDEWNRENEKALSSAKDWVEAYNLPPEAAGTIATMIKNGKDDKFIEMVATQGKWDVNKATDTLKQAPDVEKMERDQQMQQGALGGPQAAQAPGNPAAVQQAKTNMQQPNTLLGQIWKRPNKQGRVEEKAAKYAGVTPDEYRNTLTEPLKQPDFGPKAKVTMPPPQPEPDEINTSGEAAIELATAEDAVKANPSDTYAQERYEVAKRRSDALQKAAITDANIKAIAEGKITPGFQTMITKDGQIVQGKIDAASNTYKDQNGNSLEGRPLSPDDQERLFKMSEHMGKEIGEYNNKVSNFGAMADASARMKQIIGENPGVLQPWSSAVARSLVKYGEEANTAIQTLDNWRDLPANEQTLAKLKDAENKILKFTRESPVADLGLQSSLFEAQKALFVYHLAASKGQEGRNLAEAERANFKDTLERPSSAPEFDKNMANILLGTKDELTNTAKFNFENNQELKVFESIYGAKPKNLQWESPDKILQSEGTKAYVQSLENLQKVKDDQSKTDEARKKAETENDPEAQKIKTNPQLGKPVGQTKGGVKVYRNAQGQLVYENGVLVPNQ